MADGAGGDRGRFVSVHRIRQGKQDEKDQDVVSSFIHLFFYSDAEDH